MTKRISFINGANDAQDYDVFQFQTTQYLDGICEESDLEIQAQGSPDDTVIVKAGICMISVTRVTDSKDFNIFGELTDDFNLTIEDTGSNPTWIGAIIAVIPKADIEDGTGNPEDGTGVFNIISVSGLGVGALSDSQINSQTSNLYYWIRLADVLQDPTVESGDITDTRLLLSNKRLTLANNVLLKARNNAGNGYVDIIKVTTDDVREVQGLLRYKNTPTPSHDQDLANKKYIDDNVATLLPPGGLMPYGGSSAPAGWLLCDSSEVSRSTYSGLFAVIGTTFGIGDGSTTFNLPDMRGNFALGKDNMGGSPRNRVTNAAADNIGSEQGSETHTLTEAELAAHTHLRRCEKYGSGSVTVTGGGSSTGVFNNIASGSAGSNTAHENMSPYMTFNYIIKT